ncbi:copper chaperone PCu(A)C [Bartonella rattaustraliani]|uniref:copper chaperone PCu(A)C n=1 Tax=Bartonella rattaustraliani TaxID=481139 RepID=UPI0002EEF9B0|nr:copper chaperone PCu(A)C [Bartonella rattaustraliani]
MMIFIVEKTKKLASQYTTHIQYPFKKVLSNAIFVLLFACIALPAAAQQYKVGNIEILHPWTRATPKGVKVSSGYLYIINHSNTPDRLVSVSAKGIKTAEIHAMTVVNNIMKMEHMQHGIEIPGNGEVTLKPGSNHIMFMGLSKPFKAGDKITAKLTFEKAGTIDVDFSVNAMVEKSPSKPDSVH